MNGLWPHVALLTMLILHPAAVAVQQRLISSFP